MEAKIFAVLFLVSVGALSVLTQFAIIREARTVVEELSTHQNPGPVAKMIASSGQFLNLTQGLMIVLSLALLAAFLLVLA
jgi:hypothetical protein